MAEIPVVLTGHVDSEKLSAELGLPMMQEAAAKLSGRLLAVEGRLDALEAGTTPVPDPDPEPDPNPIGDLANLAPAGVGPSEWVEHPDPADITFAPERHRHSDSGRVQTGRLFVPDDGNWDEQAIDTVRQSPRGPQHLALLAIHDGDDDTLNAQAKEWYFREPYDGLVFGPLSKRDWASRVLALDWILWDAEEEFERAAALVTGLPLDKKQGGLGKVSEALMKGAYWNNDTHPQASAFGFETLLVAVCHGRPGPSGQWAAERLKHLGEDANPDTFLYSPYHAANTLTLLSRGGGGREAGGDRPNGLAGYEDYFASAGYVLFGWDTATGSTLFRDNLYFRTRADSFAVQRDSNVEQYEAGGGLGHRIRAAAASVTGNGKLAWMVLTNRSGFEHHTGAEFQACAGPLPEPVPPLSEPVAEKQGSTWFYNSNPADPDNAFRTAWCCRDVDHFRLSDWDRTFGFAWRGVGLVQGGQSYRGSRTTRHANGLSLSIDGVDLKHFWPLKSSRRASLPETVASDPYYLVQTGQPELMKPIDSSTPVLLYRWHQDWAGLVEHGGAISKLTTDWTLDPAAKRLTIVDRIEHDGTVTPRLNFSPNRPIGLLDPVTVVDDAFKISDGADAIKVSVTSSIPLEWSVEDVTNIKEHRYSFPRVRQFVRATPVEEADSYEFTTVVEAQ